MTTTVLFAMPLYYLQEMIAGFIIFSVLYLCIAAVVLMAFLLGHAVQTAFAWSEVRTRALGRATRWSWERGEGLAMSRPRHFSRIATASQK